MRTAGRGFDAPALVHRDEGVGGGFGVLARRRRPGVQEAVLRRAAEGGRHEKGVALRLRQQAVNPPGGEQAEKVRHRGFRLARPGVGLQDDGRGQPRFGGRQVLHHALHGTGVADADGAQRGMHRRRRAGR